METKKVLVVDDDEDIVNIIATILQNDQWDIYPAFNGEEAIALASSVKPDLILLDIMMPKMNGIEVLKKVKEIDPQVRIIMITAFGDVESYLDSMELGAQEYVNKPFETSELLELIEKVAAA